MVKFAENFNQEQVHLRQEATGDVGAVYPDGSFNTVTYQIELNTQIDRATIDQIIADSGLYGLTVYTNQAGNSVLEFYYYGKPTDKAAYQEFVRSANTAVRLSERWGGVAKQKTQRAYFYAQPAIADGWGAGFTIPYTAVSSELYTQPKKQPNAVVSAVAQSLNPTARGFAQRNITKKQFSKQATIARDYDKAPLYDLDNPIVRRAYEELAAEVKEQYLAMPLKGVELLTGQGEPYAQGRFFAFYFC